MIAFALVGLEELDIKRLQGCLIERQRTFDIVHSQNHVVEHCSLLQAHKGFNDLFTIGISLEIDGVQAVRTEGINIPVLAVLAAPTFRSLEFIGPHFLRVTRGVRGTLFIERTDTLDGTCE